MAMQGTLSKERKRMQSRFKTAVVLIMMLSSKPLPEALLERNRRPIYRLWH